MYSIRYFSISDANETTKGGDLLLYSQTDGRILILPTKNGTIIVGHFNKIPHKTIDWEGPRFSLNFYTSEPIYNHFKNHGQQIYNCWKNHKYPKKNKSQAVKYVLILKPTQLQYIIPYRKKDISKLFMNQ